MSGEGEIRTPVTLAGQPVFETGAFNHSATSPEIAGPTLAPPPWSVKTRGGPRRGPIAVRRGARRVSRTCGAVTGNGRGVDTDRDAGIYRHAPPADSAGS